MSDVLKIIQTIALIGEVVVVIRAVAQLLPIDKVSHEDKTTVMQGEDEVSLVVFFHLTTCCCCCFSWIQGLLYLDHLCSLQ